MWLDALGLTLVLLGVSVFDWCWLRRFHAVYHKYPSMRHQYKYNAWGVKSNMLHDHEQLNHLNPYKLITKLPLAF
jgi:hypothetical protein